MSNSGKFRFSDIGEQFRDIFGLVSNKNKGGIFGDDILIQGKNMRDYVNENGLHYQPVQDAIDSLNKGYKQMFDEDTLVGTALNKVTGKLGVKPITNSELLSKGLEKLGPSVKVEGKKPLGFDNFANSIDPNDTRFSAVYKPDIAIATALEDKNVQNAIAAKLNFLHSPRTLNNESIADALAEALSTGTAPTTYKEFLTEHLRKSFNAQNINEFVLKQTKGVASNQKKFNKFLTEKEDQFREFFTAENRELLQGHPPADIKKYIKEKSTLFNEDYLLSESRKPVREVRVHVLNGKVVPSASVEKQLNPLVQKVVDFLKHNKTDLSNDVHQLDNAMLQKFFNPFTTKTQRVTEAAVNEYLMALKKTDPATYAQIKTQSLGFDVGIDAHGKPVIYEMNPSGEGRMNANDSSHAYGSAYLMHPMVGHAIDNAIRGKLPLDTKLRRVALGAGLTGATGATALALKPPPSEWEQFVTAFKDSHSKANEFGNMHSLTNTQVLAGAAGLAGLGFGGHQLLQKKKKKKREQQPNV